MATRPETLHHHDLRNQVVIDRATLEELGKVEAVWMYPPAHRVLGFICRPKLFSSKRLAFNLGQLYSLGSSGVLVSSSPEETDSDRVRQLESLLYCEVWSDTGNRLGKIIDYQFNLQTGLISHYLFVSNMLGGVTGSLYQLFPSQILSVGNRRVRVAEGQTFTIQREGLQQKLAKANEWLREDYIYLTQELKNLTEQAQVVTEQARDRLQNLRDQVREHAQSLTEQAKETVYTLNDRFQEETDTWFDQVKDQTGDLADQWQETLDSWEGTLETMSALDDWETWEKELDAWDAEEQAKRLQAMVDGEEKLDPALSAEPAGVREVAAPHPPTQALPDPFDDDDEPWL